MRDAEFRDAVRHYDLPTLKAARLRVDASVYPERAALLDEELVRRAQGIGPEPAPEPTPFSVSRAEGYAGLVYRFPALVLDLLLVYLPAGALLEWLVGLNLLWALLPLPFLYPVYAITSTWRWQQTIGQKLLGIRVTDQAGGQPTLGQCLRRFLPDLGLATLMGANLAIALSAGMTLPEHGTAMARLSSFHFQLPAWDALDDIWDLWLWSQMLLLCLDQRRRSLREFLSRTLVVHTARLQQIDFGAPHEASWYEWLDHALARLYS